MYTVAVSVFFLPARSRGIYRSGWLFSTGGVPKSTRTERGTRVCTRIFPSANEKRGFFYHPRANSRSLFLFASGEEAATNFARNNPLTVCVFFSLCCRTQLDRGETRE